MSPDSSTWSRNAGSKTFHLQRPDWVQSGKAVCGARIERPYVEWMADPGCRICDLDKLRRPHRVYVLLADYPKNYGYVDACRLCLKKLEGK